MFILTNQDILYESIETLQNVYKYESCNKTIIEKEMTLVIMNMLGSSLELFESDDVTEKLKIIVMKLPTAVNVLNNILTTKIRLNTIEWVDYLDLILMDNKQEADRRKERVKTNISNQIQSICITISKILYSTQLIKPRESSKPRGESKKGRVNFLKFSLSRRSLENFELLD